MKASKQCPKCHSLKVGYMETAPSHVLGKEQLDSPAKRNWFAEVFDEPPTGPELRAVGLEAYVCSRCGYYETYVKDPAAVNFDKVVGLRWLNETSGTEGPYR